MKLVLICVLAVIAVKDVQSAMTEAQMASAAKLIRNVCQPKSKVSSAQIDAFHSGDFSDTSIMCYMDCTLRTAQITKDGKINMDFLNKQLENLPASMSEKAIATAAKCKDSFAGADKCTAAFEYYKCFYNDNPSNFFLP